MLADRLYVAFIPLYVLGLMGMTRHMQHYDVLREDECRKHRKKAQTYRRSDATKSI